jgi:NADH:ubiquinone oxidoreductase subunit K
VEAAVGLAIFFRMYQQTGSIDVERFNLLKW